MRRGTLALLLFIILLGASAIYIVLPNSPGIQIPFLGISFKPQVKLGLDLQGGVRALLEPDGNFDQKTLNDAMPAVRDNIEQRVNGGLGVSEPSIRIITSNGQPAISVELPGFTGNQTEAVNSLLKTGNLEFWSTGSTYVPPGTHFDPSQYAQYNPGGKPQFTGANLDSGQVFVGQDPQTGRPQVDFAMQGDAVGRFGTFTGQNVGQYLTVTLDRQVIESAVIQNAITGQGVINGNFTTQQAQQIVTVLKYGALKIPLKIASEETVGPTLGLDSIQKSAIAAVIGLGIVMLFMLLYYRL